MSRLASALPVAILSAVLTVLVQPVIRDAVDRETGRDLSATAPQIRALPGMRPAAIAISPTRMATVERERAVVLPGSNLAQEIEMRPSLKQPKRTVREGCEAALSSLVGPEARRMTPGRCMS